MVLKAVVSVSFLRPQSLTACATSRMTQSVIGWVTTRSVGTISNEGTRTVRGLARECSESATFLMADPPHSSEMRPIPS